MWEPFKHCDLNVTGRERNVPFSTKNHRLLGKQADKNAQTKAEIER
jgi:hypothetical protein